MLTANIENHEVVNIAYGERMSLNHLWENICEVTGINLKPQYGKERKGDIKHSLAGINRAKKLIGYKPLFSVTKGLQISLNWYKELTG